MGRYNPYRPVILGNEWSGIREEPYQLDPETERGHTFTLDTTTSIVSGSVFLDEDPTVYSIYNGPVIAIYPAGQEASTSPVKKLFIPCTGSTIVTGASNFSPILVNAASAHAAVLNASDSSYLILGGEYPTNIGDDAEVRFTFDVSSVQEQLEDKRILDVSVAYIFTGAFGGTITNVNIPTVSPAGITSYNNGFLTIKTTNATGGSDIVWESNPEIFQTLTTITDISRASIGDLNVMGDTTAPLPRRIYPWTYDDLLRLGPSFGTGQLYVEVEASDLWFTILSPGEGIRYSPIFLTYLALEVTYCDEKRLAYGGMTGRISSGVAVGPAVGQNVIHLRTANSATPGVSLPAGDYSVTVTTGRNNVRDAQGIGRPVSYVTRALRQAYALPTHTGVQINRSLVEGDLPRESEINVLPQLMLHTASGPVTGVHAYGELFSTQDVYDLVEVTQGIMSESGGAAVAYPQVRFYARRFGDTDVDLLFRRVSAPTQSVSISPEDFDALPEIVDGWREVTLRFTDVPTFSNTGAATEWEWNANGLTVGNHWQVLVVQAAANVGGVYASAPATYGGTTGRASQNGDTDGQIADAVVLFSQDPPTVTGVAVSLESQAVTGIGADCSETPECIPSAISYLRVTWSSLGSSFALPTFELQRSDDVDPTWQTVMLSTATVGVTGFNDYEARVGVESYYRIRVRNVYDFAGAWSDVASETVPAPGVTVTDDGNGVLIFTTNERQDGSGNLAYVMTWPNNVTEEFAFPESGEVQLHSLYRRDYVVAFRPTERGGERFSRTLLVHNAAVPTGRLRDGFTSLRDMAWNDVSYVCVRNELGDRWFATVLVPSGDVRRNRRLFLARVDIIEVTDTPSSVDPAS